MPKKNTESDKPECPECGSSDFDENQEGTRGYCFSCGTVFSIAKDKSTESIGEISPVCTRV